jgi:hypothetical protein
VPRVRVGGSSGHRAVTAMLSRRGVLAAAAAGTGSAPVVASSRAGDLDAGGRCLGSCPSLRITESGEGEGRTDLG